MPLPSRIIDLFHQAAESAASRYKDYSLKILSIFGTRPEAIKMAPVVKELRKHTSRITSLVCITAQHRQMLDQVMSLFGIEPHYDLNLMRPNQTLAQITAMALTELDEVLLQEKPDWVLTQGDTTTAMVGALIGFYHRIKVGHVEAGLRTWDKYQPFPEEINRKIADAVCDLHFAPTTASRDNLLREGVNDSSIVVTGNTVIDALLNVAEREYDWAAGELAAVPRDKRLILVTAHRRENFGQPLREICAALKEIAARFDDVHLVYPVHLNPNVQDVVQTELRNVPNITLLEPLDYLPLVQLMKASSLVLTDSGGLQEEAPGLGKPVLVLREVTERPEGVEAGTVKLVGTDKERIVRETVRLLEDADEYERMARAVNPYGDGHASERIVECLLSFQR
ncbi:MAG: UDP-N-acetylglucosamine 2-epimerase (non-hydrolyzing) [Acidobacteriota bacterium]